MSAIKVGDTVVLKSGGPPMTVQEIHNGEATCVWMDKDDQRQSAKYRIEMLEHEEPAPPMPSYED